jgi:type IV secretion system protein TrbL
VAFIATTLIVIDVTLAALFWSWGADDDIIARLVKKTLFVGVFAYIIGNWNNLARIVFESFAGLGLKASGTGFTTADLLRPGKVAQTGLDAGRPLLDSISDLMGWVSFFENFIQIACLLFAWALVLLAFFILAIQLFVTLIEFKLTTLAGFVLIPFGLFGKSAFMAERVLGNVISSGIKVLVLAVIIGIGSTLFSEFTRASAARRLDRRRHGDRARRAVAARPRHLRSRHRQRPRLRRPAAWRRRGGRHRPRRRRHGRSGRPPSARSRRRCAPLPAGAAAARGGAALAGGASTAYSLGAAGQSGASGVASGLGNVASTGAQPARRCRRSAARPPA